jgi:hypothetical protein
MYLLETSQDVLNITKSVSIFALAVFVCWFIYYLARIMQQVFRAVKEMRDRLHKIDELFKVLKEKIESSASYLFLIVEGIKKIVAVMSDRQEKRSQRSKK